MLLLNSHVNSQSRGGSSPTSLSTSLSSFKVAPLVKSTRAVTKGVEKVGMSTWQRSAGQGRHSGHCPTYPQQDPKKGVLCITRQGGYDHTYSLHAAQAGDNP